ncbi:MAG: hypothetical protein M3077_02425 [Candidatus Dormibacteraeota bacterium]|nr:hypothetical protein [Candidatus Dormibacteraeota bacterium]
MTRTRRAGLIAIVAGVLASLVVHGRGAAPPVFDGIITPPSPYHWQSPPPELRAGNVPPSPGDATFPVHNGQVAGGSLQTGDAQVVIYFGVGLFKLSDSAQSVRCRVTPLANPPPAPAGVQIRGNVYAIGCVEQPVGTALPAVGTFSLTMRYPSGPFREIQVYDGTAWHALPTTQVGGGNPFAGARPAAFGDFAATAPAGAKGPGLLDFLGRYLEFYGIILFVILFGVIAIIQEVRRRRKIKG